MLFLWECHKLKLLQKFGFQKSSYERPTQKWVCGHSDAGKPCAIGPSGSGVCQATFECQPHKSETEDRWECTRPAARGGVCEQGPLPNGVCCKAITKCKPHLSLRAKRGRVVRWAVSLAVGFIVILVAFGADMRLLSPGPVNSVHSSLKSCSTCHANIPGGPGNNFAWLQSIFTPADTMKGNLACLDCHKNGKEALSPHGVEQSKLASITKRHQSVLPIRPPTITASFRKAMFPVEEVVKAGVGCATCHKEHQGKNADISAMPDAKCQTCHVAQFTDFQNGHPKFTNYPSERRTRLIFDHAKHFNGYFPKAIADGNAPDNQPGVCADCHVTDGNKGLMVVEKYEQMCSVCHAGQIVGNDRANGPKGITLLALPGLDLAVLRERNADIGEWPEDSDAEIPPMMKLLIGWDDKRRKMLEAVEKLDLLDLTDATDEDITVVENFVWEIKSLIYQFAASKPTDAMKMLSPKMGGSIDAELLASLTANMPRDVMLGVQRDWLPNLSTEVLRRLRGQRLMPDEPEAKEAPVDETTEADAATPPPEKSADGSDDSILSGNDDILAENKDDSILPGNDDILAEEKDDSILSGNDDILAEEKDDSILSGNDDILAEKKDDDILSGNDDILAEKKDDDILSGNDDILAENKDDDILAGDTGKEEVAKANVPEDKPVEMPEPMESEDWAELGGWYRLDFAVLYKPIGHRDNFMRAWLDFTGEKYGDAKVKQAAPIFDMMTDKQAQGQCAKCHSVDAAGAGSRQVNWAPFKVTKTLAKFTKFSHEPHFGLFPDKGCTACHTVDSKAKYLETYKEFDPLKFASSFEPIQQPQCSTCHVKKAAGQSCVLCHSYHVNKVITPIMSTRLKSN